MRRRPLLMVHTGTMKGKSTAAFGTALRAWSAGLSVGVFQFIKGARWRPGEWDAFQALDQAHAATGVGAPVEWQALGRGPSWQRKPGTVEDDRTAAIEAWHLVSERLAEQRHGFYLLDELTYPIAWGWLDPDEVVGTLLARPGFAHVVVTGRDAHPALVEAADLVVDLRKVKHPLDEGVRGQRGIEW
jgi:cob(I)alamin adenosyltransferase